MDNYLKQCAAALVLCMGTISSPAVAADQLRIGWQPWVPYAAVVMAKQHGWVEQELAKAGQQGVAVKWVQVAQGPAANEALASGALDAAILGDTPALTGHAVGIDTICVGLASTGPKAWGLVVLKDSSIQSVKELKGKKAVLGPTGGLLGNGGRGALGFGDDTGAQRFGGMLVGVVVEHGRQALAHVPFQVVCEHAQKHVGAHTLGQPVIDRPDLEIDGLDAAEGALHQAEGFVAAHRGGVVERSGGQAGAHDIDAVEGRLGGDGIGLAGEAEAGVGDVKGKVLGHLVVVEHGADLEPDFGLAAQRLAFAGDGGSDAGEIALSGGKQILALARALGGERAVAADDQALAGEIG